MSTHPQAVATIEGASVMQPDGTFRVRAALRVADGRFAAGPSGSGVAIDATGLWAMPGVYDCHGHVSWSDFDAADRARRTPEQRAEQTAAALAATLRAGVVAVRDAGGAPAALRDAVARGEVRGPRLQVAVDLLGPELAGDEDRLRAAVDTALDRGADWIKLLATPGVGGPADACTDSFFTDREFRLAVEHAAAAGARVMVHAWGGRAIDAAVDAGAASIEHGVLLTARQARRAAAAGLVLVPTLTIYRDVQRMVAGGRLRGVAAERVASAVDAHPAAVAHALDAGLAIALGSDFGTAQQHGGNLREIAALMRAGLRSTDALLAATTNGAALLGVADGGAIADGRLADAVLLTADPADPATFDAPGTVAAVMMSGELLHVGPGLDLGVPTPRPPLNRSTA